jgi:uncharacterized caspase-like protein
MRRALLVGINDYPDSPLTGCVHDAEMIGQSFARNADGSPNFDCRYLLSGQETIDRRTLAHAVEELFASEADIAVFYFSGHGAVDVPGGYLVTPDAQTASDRYSMRDVLAHATKSKVREVVVILDCCFSGTFGNSPELAADQAILREGIAILAASRPYESAHEVGGAGVFTTLLFDALNGSAADVLGRVTVGSIYAHIDLALGAWDQRPMFKAHLSRFTPLRYCEPPVDAAILRLLPTYFPTADHELALDPTFEPEIEPKNEKNERTFAHLQKLRDAHLLVAVGEKHLYYAAVNSKACRLTTFGRFYWQLAKEGRI